MILYFSATGNSLHVAAKLARATGEAHTDMAEALRTGRLRCRLRPGERLGIVTPVYFWGLPEAVDTFLWLMDIEVTDGSGSGGGESENPCVESSAMPPGWPYTTTAGWRARHRAVGHAAHSAAAAARGAGAVAGASGEGRGERDSNPRQATAPAPYIYCVLTYGTSTGGAAAQIARAMARHGWRLQGRFRVRMVDVWTPLFNLTDRARCLSRTRRAETQIARVARAVSLRLPSAGFDPTALPTWLAALQYRFYRPMRRTTRFHLVEGRCTGCGLCAARCPDRAIVMRPVTAASSGDTPRGHSGAGGEKKEWPAAPDGMVNGIPCMANGKEGESNIFYDDVSAPDGMASSIACAANGREGESNIFYDDVSAPDGMANGIPCMANGREGESNIFYDEVSAPDGMANGIPCTANGKEEKKGIYNKDVSAPDGMRGRNPFPTRDAQAETENILHYGNKTDGTGEEAPHAAGEPHTARREPCWTKERCQLCLRCLHHCPAFAIQYGSHTARHGQFVHPDEAHDTPRPRPAASGTSPVHTV